MVLYVLDHPTGTTLLCFNYPPLLPCPFAPLPQISAIAMARLLLTYAEVLPQKYSKERQGIEMKIDKECVARLIQDRANLVACMCT